MMKVRYLDQHYSTEKRAVEIIHTVYKKKKLCNVYTYEVPRTQKHIHSQKIILGLNAPKNNDGAKQSHDVSGSEYIPMDTPDVPTVPIETNQVIPSSAIYRSETTGASRMTLNKMHVAPNNYMTAYVLYCDDKRSSVVQMYPDRSKSDIRKMMLAGEAAL